MNITQCKDGYKSVKILSINVLIETIRSRESGHVVEEFREKLQEYPLGYPCPAAAKLPCVVFGAELKRTKEEVEMKAYNGLILLEVENLSGHAVLSESCIPDGRVYETPLRTAEK